jgi:hypothetical protein
VAAPGLDIGLAPVGRDELGERAPVQPALGGFSEVALLDHLEGEKSAPAARKGGGWREYREVIFSAVGGALVLTGVILWQRARSVEPAPLESAPSAEPAPAPPDPGPAPSAPPPAPRRPAVVVSGAPEAPPPVAAEPAVPASPAPIAERPADGTAEAGSEGRSTSTPMLSVVSAPRGALVEIDGVVYGKTPLIMPSPRGKVALEVLLRLEGHKKWQSTLQPSPSGHYALNVTLEPL